MGLLCFCFTSLCDWSVKLVLLSQPIRWKSKTNRDLVVCVFPRCRQLVVFTLSSHWLLKALSFLLIGRCDHFGFGFTTLNRKAPNNSTCLIAQCFSLVPLQLRSELIYAPREITRFVNHTLRTSCGKASGWMGFAKIRDRVNIWSRRCEPFQYQLQGAYFGVFTGAALTTWVFLGSVLFPPNKYPGLRSVQGCEFYINASLANSTYPNGSYNNASAKILDQYGDGLIRNEFKGHRYSLGAEVMKKNWDTFRWLPI